MKQIDLIATIFIVAGAINWGLIGVFDFDLIDYVFTKIWIERLIYALIGISALYKIVNWQANKEHSKM